MKEAAGKWTFNIAVHGETAKEAEQAALDAIERAFGLRMPSSNDGDKRVWDCSQESVAAA